MLASIHPLGERARHNRWGVTVAAYGVASLVGGAAAGAIVGGIGWLATRLWAPPLSARLAVAAVATAAAVGWDLVAARSLPPFRQVDEDWLASYRGWVYGAGFGLQLGAGLTTIVTTALVPLVFVVALLGATPAWGAVVGGVFGVARSLPMLSMRRVVSAASLRSFHIRLQAWQSSARLIAPGCAVVAVTMALVGSR